MGGDCGHLLRRGVASLNEFSDGTFQFTALLGSRVWEKLSICNPDTVRSAGLPQNAVGTSAGEIKGRELSQAGSGQSYQVYHKARLKIQCVKVHVCGDGRVAYPINSPTHNRYKSWTKYTNKSFWCQWRETDNRQKLERSLLLKCRPQRWQNFWVHTSLPRGPPQPPVCGEDSRNLRVSGLRDSRLADTWKVRWETVKERWPTLVYTAHPIISWLLNCAVCRGPRRHWWKRSIWNPI